MSTYIVSVCLLVILNGCIHNLKRPWPIHDITSFSHMQKIEVTGASDFALLFLHQGFFCIAYSLYHTQGQDTTPPILVTLATRLLYK